MATVTELLSKVQVAEQARDVARLGQLHLALTKNLQYSNYAGMPLPDVLQVVEQAEAALKRLKPVKKPKPVKPPKVEVAAEPVVVALEPVVVDLAQFEIGRAHV